MFSPCIVTLTRVIRERHFICHDALNYTELIRFRIFWGFFFFRIVTFFNCLKNLTKDSKDVLASSRANVIIAKLSTPISSYYFFSLNPSRIESWKWFHITNFCRSKSTLNSFLQRNAITINVTMFSAARIVIQQHFSQHERIIVLIAAALSAHQGELFAKGSTRSECRD